MKYNNKDRVQILPKDLTNFLGMTKCDKEEQAKINPWIRMIKFMEHFTKKENF